MKTNRDYYMIACKNCKHGERCYINKKPFYNCKKGVGTFPASSRFMSCAKYEIKEVKNDRS